MIVRIVAAALLTVAAASAQERCGTAQDMVVRALERLTGAGGNAEITDALQLVKQATGECAGLGDAWYYRSVFENKLGHKQLADYALQKAKMLGSEAMNESADPFRLAAPPGPPPSKVIHDKYAVVIGVGKFHDSRIPSLRYTAKDARDFAATLTDPQVGRFPAANVHFIGDGDATTVRIKTELNWLARTAGPDDLAVIYLASHGSSRDMDTAGVNYVVTYDTEVQDQDHLYATALPMVEIAEVVRTRMKARRAAVFLDTCHSEGALANMRTGSATGNMLSKMDRGVGRVIITSSQVAEKSWESEKIGNGYFTYFLIRALKERNGMTPIEKIYEELKSEVSQAVRQDVSATQTPVMARSEQGAADLVIGVGVGQPIPVALRPAPPAVRVSAF